jgi:hypothetical protein
MQTKQRASINIDLSLLKASHALASKPSKALPLCPKRMLSSQTLSAVLNEKGDSPKRQRIKFSDSLSTLDQNIEKDGSQRATDVVLPELPLFDLGEPAHPSFAQMRGMEREASSSEDEYEVEMDRQLDGELHAKGSDNEESEPVPLLTPPASPLTIHGDKGDTTVCEWPSNVAVDCAYSTAINDTRPLSPTSLQKQEQDEEQRILQSPKYSQRILPDPDPSTGLTPRITGISVGFRPPTSTTPQ